MKTLYAALLPERQRLTEGYAALRKAYETHSSSTSLLRGLASLVDDATVSVWQKCNMPAEATLAAVGGYGRGMLFPHSDVDLLILLPTAANEATQERLAILLSALWDIGLKVGHSVRTIEQCLEVAKTDITAQTSLLEARLLAGNAKLFDAFTTQYRAALDPHTFFKAKQLEQEQRYSRYQDSPFFLEPNCKEGPGGLRDLQILNWIARATQLGESWRDLAQNSLTEIEAEELREAEKFLRHVRIRLHYLTERAEDRLLFDYQERLAHIFKIKATRSKRAAEVFMRRYYLTVKKVTQLNTILLRHYTQLIFPQIGSPIIINTHFQSVRELLDVRDEALFAQRPTAIFECFLLFQKRIELKGLTTRTLRALWAHRKKINAAFRADPLNKALFIEILQQKRRVSFVLGLMNQYDILPRYLTAWSKIVCQMQYDLFHAYTVDQHILMVVRNIRRFTLGENISDYPLMTRLMLNFGSPLPLYIAALFHDIAKGRGGDHSLLGVADARTFCKQHSLAPKDTDLVVWLVRNHLLMSMVAQKEDISNPDVIIRFAEAIKTEHRLVALYLLTHADIRGTGPKIWNAWKARLLEDLFIATQRLLRGEKPTQALGVDERQENAAYLLRYYGLMQGIENRFWKQLDPVYFMRHTVNEIVWHTRQLYYQSETESPIIKSRIAENDVGLQIMIYIRDQKDLFIRLTGFFGSQGFSILDAKVHTTKHGYALDTFIIQPVSSMISERELITLIEKNLSEYLNSDRPPQRPTTNRQSRQLKHFPISPQVKIRAAENSAEHILSIVAADRPGLLFDIAEVLAQHNINLLTAKISTLGERAEDTFLIKGENLFQESSIVHFEQKLLEKLQH